MWGHSLRVQVGGYFQTQDRQGVRVLVKISLATLNIRPVRAGGMEAALRTLRKGKTDVGVLQEAKLMDRIRARQEEGYSAWATKAEIGRWVGIAVVWREYSGWQVKRVVNFGPNVSSFFLTSGLRRWYVIGAYVPPHGAPAVHRI